MHRATRAGAALAAAALLAGVAPASANDKYDNIPSNDPPATFRYVEDAAPAVCRTETAHAGLYLTRVPNPVEDELAKDFCVTYAGPATVVSGGDAVLSFRICRSAAPGVTAYRLSGFGLDGNYPWTFVEYWQEPKKQRGWGGYWDGASADVGTGGVVVHPGDCAQWDMPWTALGERWPDYNHLGPLDPGTYTLQFLAGVNEFRHWERVAIQVTAA